jgi:hypothetical protein
MQHKELMLEKERILSSFLIHFLHMAPRRSYPILLRGSQRPSAMPADHGPGSPMRRKKTGPGKSTNTRP